MSMTFRYRLLRARQAVWSLGGRWVRPRPLVPVTAVGPGGTYVHDGLLDTGADDTVFSETVAQRIGIDLTNAPVGEATGIHPIPTPVRYAEVTLRIAGNGERREWIARVGFTALPLQRPLLGFAGFLQFFTATFRGDREEVELTINALYNGS